MHSMKIDFHFKSYSEVERVIFYSSKSTITLTTFYLSTNKSSSLKIYSSKSEKVANLKCTHVNYLVIF